MRRISKAPPTSSSRLLMLLATGLLPALSSSACADDWPQWRGPARDGVCAESGLLQSFPVGGLKVRWRAPVGWGFSSPVVAQGRVYLADSQLNKPSAKERLRQPRLQQRHLFYCYSMYP